MSFNAEVFMQSLSDERLAMSVRQAKLRQVTENMNFEVLESLSAWMLARAQRIILPPGIKAMDVCGTGGDRPQHGIKTFNVSTLVALVLASLGLCILKHGNRAVSSKSGSSDLVQALGLSLAQSSQEVEKDLSHGLSFIFAPAFHPVLSSLVELRKSLGQASIFNFLGPLCHPASLSFQVMGVYDDSSAKDLAQLALNLGRERILIVHGQDGMDEISIMAPTSLVMGDESGLHCMNLCPQDLGLSIPSLAEVQDKISAVDVSQSLWRTQEILAGKNSLGMQVVALNAGAALWTAGKVKDMRQGYDQAYFALESGCVLKFVEGLKHV